HSDRCSVVTGTPRLAFLTALRRSFAASHLGRSLHQKDGVLPENSSGARTKVKVCPHFSKNFPKCNDFVLDSCALSKRRREPILRKCCGLLEDSGGGVCVLRLGGTVTSEKKWAHHTLARERTGGKSHRAYPILVDAKRLNGSCALDTWRVLVG